MLLLQRSSAEHSEGHSVCVCTHTCTRTKYRYTAYGERIACAATVFNFPAMQGSRTPSSEGRKSVIKTGSQQQQISCSYLELQEYNQTFLSDSQKQKYIFCAVCQYAAIQVKSVYLELQEQEYNQTFLSDSQFKNRNISFVPFAGTPKSKSTLFIWNYRNRNNFIIKLFSVTAKSRKNIFCVVSTLQSK